jgi:hypothetical protein
MPCRSNRAASLSEPANRVNRSYAGDVKTGKWEMCEVNGNWVCKVSEIVRISYLDFRRWRINVFCGFSD